MLDEDHRNITLLAKAATISIIASGHPLHIVPPFMPSSLQGEHRAGGRVHMPSRVAPSVGHHQLLQGSSTDYTLRGLRLGLSPWW